MVGPPGFEPGTSPLSGARSDQLSYGPSRVSGTGRGLAVQRGPYHGREPCLEPVIPAPDLRATGGLRGGESARGLPAVAAAAAYRHRAPPEAEPGDSGRRCQCGAGRDRCGRRIPRGVGEGRRPSPWGLPRHPGPDLLTFRRGTPADPVPNIFQGALPTPASRPPGRCTPTTAREPRSVGAARRDR